MPQKRRSLLILALIVFVCSLLGGLYGPKIEVAAAASNADEVQKDLRKTSLIAASRRQIRRNLGFEYEILLARQRLHCAVYTVHHILHSASFAINNKLT